MSVNASALRLARTAAVAGFVVIGLAGCGAMVAQNPSGTLKPVNAVADNPEGRLMLKGADVVAYFTQGRYVQGQPQFRSQYEGVDFRFASAEHKALFDKEPARYLPQFGGYCANGIAYGIPWGGDADRFKLIEGKLYIFGGQGSLDAWNLDEPSNLQLARKYWQEEVQGSNSFIQRTRRLVFKVPHYKSGEELAKMVAEAKAKK
ncbi:YHS domain-containing (seleno)protein [Ramlibacter sp.]|uniref:YHS domain-containing (seleno)protein n=1 Tax=Ramlibacter sp. TaxID=1917967 RepID=UPI0035AE2CCE